MGNFGSFEVLCRRMPAPWCNLFMRQLSVHSPGTLVNLGLSANLDSAPVGVNPSCGILRLNHGSDTGNIANIVCCGVSFLVVLFIIGKTHRRRAAVARVEFRFFLFLYLISLVFNLLTTGSIFEQGSKTLTILTAIHAGIVSALFWTLVGNAIVSTQLVEDGTPSALVPFYALTVAFFVAGLYISLDVGLTFTSALGPSNPPEALNSIPLFVFTNIWPGAAALIYFIMMLYVVLGLLREVRPVWNYIIAATLFVLSQLDFYLLSETICKGSGSKIDGSFVATILETATVFVLYLAWRSITEETWDDDDYYRNSVAL